MFLENESCYIPMCSHFLGSWPASSDDKPMLSPWGRGRFEGIINRELSVSFLLTVCLCKCSNRHDISQKNKKKRWGGGICKIKVGFGLFQERKGKEKVLYVNLYNVWKAEMSSTSNWKFSVATLCNKIAEYEVVGIGVRLPTTYQESEFKGIAEICRLQRRRNYCFLYPTSNNDGPWKIIGQSCLRNLTNVHNKNK